MSLVGTVTRNVPDIRVEVGATDVVEGIVDVDAVVVVIGVVVEVAIVVVGAAVVAAVVITVVNPIQITTRENKN